MLGVQTVCWYGCHILHYVLNILKFQIEKVEFEKFSEGKKIFLAIRLFASDFGSVLIRKGQHVELCS